MRDWNLKQGDPLNLILAADARLAPTDYLDDQVWHVSLAGGEPPALAVQTTFGLRARSMRMFPRFVAGDEVRLDPTTFFTPPVVHRVYPNYIALSFSPFLALDVQLEYWVPESHALAGRVRITNSSRTARQLRFEWIGILNPNEGQRMAAVEMLAAPVLRGKTENLSPVIFMTGGIQAGSGSYPSLNIQMDLQPGQSRVFTLVEAALPTAEASFDLARKIATAKWDAEIARLDLLNGSLVDIYTGNPDWDAAFWLSQKTAYGLFAGPTEKLPYPSFVLNRQPDQGYSLRGNGSDYNHLWNGQTPLEAYYLSRLVLPASPDLAAGLLHNFFAEQGEDGFVDWKPGLGGQRGRLLATPLLASLAWQIYKVTEDTSFLEEIFPKLWKFVQSWFAPLHDRDEDGIPEWDHPMQTGLEDAPLYARWHSSSQAVDVTTSESPALCAMLYHECQTLTNIAREIGRRELIPAIESLAVPLLKAVDTAWDPNDHTYHYWDRDTHQSPLGSYLGEIIGPGELHVNQDFLYPQRLLLRVKTSETTIRPQIFAHGTGITGNPRIERLDEDGFRWNMGMGSLTSKRTYTSLDRLEILGLGKNDRLELYSPNYQIEDLSLLLPLWAGMPDGDRAEELIDYTLNAPERYGQIYGIPVCPGQITDLEDACASTHLPWNALLGEGLLQYGKRGEAAKLVSRLMESIVKTLKSEGNFRRYYHAASGKGMGDRNALSGLAPLGLFLDSLGLQLYSPHRIRLAGFNPYPWPITVKYRGTTVLLQKEKSMVIFPDGQTVVIRDPAPQVIALEADTSEIIESSGSVIA